MKRKIDPQPRLAMEDPEPSLEQLIECVHREIEYREHVYPRRIEKGTMSPAFAERQIRLMQAVLKNLEAQRERA